ncbi:uncharacterized protein M6B38_262985 [Iris pallida]|uniref:Uncharacterized protein n=1 Tax=Iris pallida TaxID=29817 RepID=A0AAX6IFB8_IRIPA|nr:uncharacterized protein M6B38_262985 [Iris pallida]
MVVMFCGTRSFSRVDADDDGSWASSRRRPKPSSKLKLRKKTKKSLSALGGRSGKNRSNPYSASGLDKFAKLLAELEAEKREILRKKGSGEDTVRFRYGSAEERIPIVIKRPQSPPAKKKNTTKILSKKEKEDVDDAAEAERAQAEAVTNGGTRKAVSKSSWCWNWWSGVVPWWAVAVAVVLLCMTFGRAFAVSWAAILWYMVPMMKCDRRKEYGKSWLGRVFFRVTGGCMSTSMIKVKKKMGDGTSVAQELQASPG